ncbi:MAG TPA: MarR family transcriptional regulator [Solirubrobacterales bacterium]|nr:MarR family transcriptional regulator [Solirubrobacterales bacterium]
MPGRSRLANDAWEALLTAHAEIMRRLAEEDVWCEVSMREYDVLYTLSKCREPIRLGELNRRVLLSQPALSRMVDRLVERGLVRRDADPGDGRSVRLSLTAEGRAQQHRTGRPHALGVARRMKSALDEDEMVELRALCRKLAGAQEPTTAGGHA